MHEKIFEGDLEKLDFFLDNNNNKKKKGKIFEVYS